MCLQNLIKQKINNSCGLSLIIEELDQTAKYSNKHDQFYINNLIIYLRSLYVIKVDVLQDYIDNMVAAIKTLDILKKHLDRRFSEPLSILLEILEYNINYTSNVIHLRVV